MDIINMSFKELKKSKSKHLARRILQQQDEIINLKTKLLKLEEEKKEATNDTYVLGADNKILSGDIIETYSKEELGGEGYGW